MSKHEVIIGDAQWEKKENLELKEVNYGGKDLRWFLGETEFDGHHTLWGFEYFPTTYLKSSGLSGDEYRKGGEIRYFRNRKQCFSEFCREPNIAALKIGATLLKLQDFNWDNLKIGTKVWFERTPAVVKMILEDQGCVVLETEDGADFPNAVWHDAEDGAMGERQKTVKVEILADNLYWYRREPTPNAESPQTEIGSPTNHI